MKLERMTVGGRSYHSVNGKPIRQDTLEIVGREIFPADKWAAVQETLVANGYAECKIVAWDTDASQELDAANKKIAALEKKVAELIIQNLYLQTA